MKFIPNADIPKKLHFVWIGEESKEPKNCINTWKELHNDWEIKIWRNKEWKERDWITKRHMDQVEKTGQLCGVADLMRWEILLEEGGIAIDADSVCLKSLPQWLLNCELFACWDNEIIRPGLIANGIVGTKPQNFLIRYLVESFTKQKIIATRFSWKKLKRKPVAAWKATGPLAFTQAFSETQYTEITILPSHFFNPIHYSGYTYKGRGPVYCTQLFAGTEGSQYDKLYKLHADDLRNHVQSQLRNT